MSSVYEFNNKVDALEFLTSQGYRIVEGGGILPDPMPPCYNPNCIIGKLSKKGSVSIGNHTKISVRDRQNTLRKACTLYLKETVGIM